MYHIFSCIIGLIKAMENSPMLVKSRSLSGILRCMTRQSSACSKMEDLFHQYTYNLQLSALIKLMWIFTILTFTISITHFVFLRQLTAIGAVMIFLWLSVTAMLLFTNSRFMHQHNIFSIKIAMFLSVVIFITCTMPINILPTFDREWQQNKQLTPTEGLLETSLVIFAVYIFMPVQKAGVGLFGATLSTIHLVLSCFSHHSNSTELWHQVRKKFGVSKL